MTDSFVTIKRHGVISTVTVNRPPANAFELQSTRQLCHAVQTLLTESHVDGIVLTGSGECFSAGLDLKLVPQYSREDQRAMVRELARTVMALYGSPKPVVAAVNGHAVAAGTLFALCCDYRIGPETGARFGLTGARVGIPYPIAALEVITNELGMRGARSTLLTALTFDADEAHTRGILDEVVPAPRVFPRALEVATDLAGLPADTYAQLKLQLRKGALERIRASLEDDPVLDVWI